MQFLILALQRLHTLRLCGSNAVVHARIGLYALDLFIECPQHAANLGGDGFNGCPQRWVFATVVLQYPYCAFAHIRGKLV